MTAGAAPARNRVTPLGAIRALTGRGAWTGNRGRLHEGAGTRDIVRTHASRAWIVCRLEFRGRRIAQWHPRHYTPLFFLDEAVALAAGHRPCAECRRADFVAFRDRWAAVHPDDAPRAPAIDARLHAERRAGPTTARWADLPDGAFVLRDDVPAVVVGERLVAFDEPAYAYGAATPRPRRGTASVITPSSTLAVLRAGFPVEVSAAARAARPAPR